MSKLGGKSDIKLTPYQGKRRCFGYYKCSECHKEWQSAYSWANTFQKCKQCNISVYPYSQRPLEAPGENKIDPNKNHRADLCEKCKMLGRICSQGQAFNGGKKAKVSLEDLNKSTIAILICRIRESQVLN